VVAQLAVRATMENAYGAANKTIFEARAVESTVKEVVTKQAESFAVMKKDLNFDNTQIIEYLKVNLIKDYPEGRMAIALDL
jgi:hypothetical protein